MTACRLVEEDQVLRLIKDLSANGQLEVIINQKDKTGRVSKEDYKILLHGEIQV